MGILIRIAIGRWREDRAKKRGRGRKIQNRDEGRKPRNQA